MKRLALLALAASGCATFHPEKGHDQVSRLVEERTGAKTGWEAGPPDDARIAQRIDELLAGGLTQERAVAIALLNNRGLQATYEDLSVAQADMVQAGLLKNPGFSGSIGFPILDSGPENEFSLVADFLDLFVLPLRKRIAAEQFAADTHRVAHQALEVAAEARKAVVAVQAADRLASLRREVVETARLGADFSERQRAAGNITDLANATERAAFEAARVELLRDEWELLEAREKLNRLLGLWGPRTAWKLAEPLAEMPAADPRLDAAEQLAVERRLDLSAARQAADLMARAADLARSTRWFGRVEVGVHSHRDPDGPRLFGPTLSIELPIFDQRQAAVARADALARQARRRLDGLAVDARSEARLAAARVATTRTALEHTRKELLPLREKVTQLTQLQYNAMQVGLPQLLTARREQVEAYRAYLTALRDHHLARIDLERATSGRPARADARTP